METPPPASSNAFAAQVLSGVPRGVMNSLSVEQRTAIAHAVKAAEPLVQRHSVNIRLSVPTPFRRCYLTVLAGRDLRSPERRAADRRANPLVSATNVAFLALVALVFGGLGALAAALI